MRRAFLGLVAASCYVMLARPAAADGCPEGYKQVGTRTEETADAIIEHPVCEPIESPSKPPPRRPAMSAAAKDYCTQQVAITSHIAPALRDLRRMSPNARAWQRDMDEWIELGQAARTEAQIKAASAAYDVASAALHVKLENKIALKENEVQKLQSLYWSKLQGVPPAVRKQLEGDVRRLHTQGDLLLLLDHLKLTADRAYGTAQPMSEGHLGEGFAQFTAGTLQEALELMPKADPAAAMTVTAVDMGLDAGYGWWARLAAEHRVNELIGLNEKQLDVAKSLSKVYIDGVNKRLALEKAWRTEHGALPYCGH